MSFTCSVCGLTDHTVQQSDQRPAHGSTAVCVEALREELAYHQELMGWLAEKLDGFKWDELIPNTFEPVDVDDFPIRFIKAEDFWAWASEMMRYEEDLNDEK